MASIRWVEIIGDSHGVCGESVQISMNIDKPFYTGQFARCVNCQAKGKVIVEKSEGYDRIDWLPSPNTESNGN